MPNVAVGDLAEFIPHPFLIDDYVGVRCIVSGPTTYSAPASIVMILPNEPQWDVYMLTGPDRGTSKGAFDCWLKRVPPEQLPADPQKLEMQS